MSNPPRLKKGDPSQSIMNSNRRIDSTKYSMKKQSIKNTFHPATAIPNVINYQNKYNLHLDDLMIMFLLKIELKRIAKRKNAKTAFVHNNPHNTYIKQSKRKKKANISKTDMGDTTDLEFDTLDSIHDETVDKDVTDYTLEDETEIKAQPKTQEEIIIQDGGHEIVMKKQTISSKVQSEREMRDNEIILKHERGEKLTPQEVERMEIINIDLTQTLQDGQGELIKEKMDEIIVIKNDQNIVMQTESKEKFLSNDLKILMKDFKEKERMLKEVEFQKKEMERKNKKMQEKVENIMQEMDEMQKNHGKQIDEMTIAIDTLKDQQNNLQNEIEKKNEFISIEKNDKEGYNGLLEKIQKELNSLKREKNEEKYSLIAKSKELEETENNLAKKIKELAECRSQVYDLKNQIAHLKSKNQKLQLGMSSGGDSKLMNELANQLESEKDILKFTQDEYEDHMKRIENIMTANETEKLLLQREIKRLRGEVEDVRFEMKEIEELNKEKQEKQKEKKQKKDNEEDIIRLQKKQRELEVMKDQNKKLFEDNKILSNKYSKQKAFRKEIKVTSDRLFFEMNKNRESYNFEAINFDFTETGNPLANMVLATQVFKNDSQKKKRASSNQGDSQLEILNEHLALADEKPIKASPPIKSRVSPPPSDHFMARINHEKSLEEDLKSKGPKLNFSKKVKQKTKKKSEDEAKKKDDEKKKKFNYIQIETNNVLDTKDYDRNEYLNRTKSPRVKKKIFLIKRNQ